MFRGSVSYFSMSKIQIPMNLQKLMMQIIQIIQRFHESRESITDNNTSNKNENQSNFKKSTQTKLNKLNTELKLLKPLVFKQFTFIKKSLQDINHLYLLCQQNETTFFYTKSLIYQAKNLEDKNKSKNKIIQSLIERKTDIFQQTQTQNEKEHITYKFGRSKFKIHI